MRAFYDHAARHFGNVAQRVNAVAAGLDRDQVAGLHRDEGARPALAIGHLRGPRGQASRVAVGEADARLASRLRNHGGDARTPETAAPDARRETRLQLVRPPGSSYR